ncbi:hypothetical protein CCM_01076 [Cordyceps militaris CM01]|uniref:NF-kappa-B inhibitor-like protein 1 n=1 Tax=Cordyceps militaris (strain CM01) TaxID=983644 RepID=G3J2T6_CORMM|nr:uncharacterized protein CCM_01076 [Cordyceps militaris CM01]EGX96420.1 hypothetical protein CCM_01076 [Cordyceps militaris CM01]
MNDDRTSPKRRHILSSINPENLPFAPLRSRHSERRSRSATPPPRSPRKEPTTDGGEQEPDGDDTTRPRRSRLKLKGEASSRTHRSRRRRSRERPDDRDRKGSPRRHRHRSRDGYENADEEKERSRRHRHRHRRRSRSPTPPNPHEPAPLDPEAAFRESLFDAMADDDGAAYWEGVYGQPVHIYEQDKVGPQGELERMTDDEYAAHVRQRMWEKTHAGLLEERARREERRKKKEDEARHSQKLHEEMERSLRRGEARREKRRWAQRWEDYTTAWDHWDGAVQHMAWPWEGGGAVGAAKRAAGWGIVEDGAEEPVDEDAVRAFFVHGLAAEEIGEAAFVARLKDERVRWHPDKMQQRLGGTVDDKVMRDVTAIFQIIDRLWADMRKKE